MKNDNLTFHYIFNLQDGRRREHFLEVNPNTLIAIKDEKAKAPAWASMDFAECVSCQKLDPNATHCPAALQIAPLLESFKDVEATDIAGIQLITNARTYSKQTDCITGLRALLGLIMVTSGCPSLGRFRPLVQSHIPFVTISESTYRLISTYLLAQFFRMKEGKQADLNLEDIDKVMMEISFANEIVRERLVEANAAPIFIKAVETLDALSGFAGHSLNTTWMDRLEKLFTEHSNWMSDE